MSVAGIYDVVTKTPMGEQKGKFTVNVDGDAFTGGVANAMGSMEVKDGKVDGDTLTWKMRMTLPMPLDLDCIATVDGDSISGKINTGAFGTMDMSGTRAA